MKYRVRNVEKYNAVGIVRNKIQRTHDDQLNDNTIK